MPALLLLLRQRRRRRLLNETRCPLLQSCQSGRALASAEGCRSTGAGGATRSSPTWMTENARGAQGTGGGGVTTKTAEATFA